MRLPSRAEKGQQLWSSGGRRNPPGKQHTVSHQPDPNGSGVLPAGRYPAVLIGVVRLKHQIVEISDVEAVHVTRVLLAWQTGMLQPSGLNHFVTQIYTISREEASPIQDLALRWKRQRLTGNFREAIKLWMGSSAWVSVRPDPQDADTALLVGVDPLPLSIEPPQPCHPLLLRDTDNPIPKVPWHARIVAADQSSATVRP